MKKYYLIVILLLFILLSGCGFGQIEDINGEDNYQLATLTEEDLVKSKSSSVIIGSFVSTKNNKYTQKVKKMSGVSKIIDLSDNSSYSIAFNVTSGNGLVGITCGDDIIKLVNPNSSVNISVPNGKKYIVQVVGESLEFEIIIIEK